MQPLSGVAAFKSLKIFCIFSFMFFK
jgi:hypothetical protein